MGADVSAARASAMTIAHREQKGTRGHTATAKLSFDL